MAGRTAAIVSAIAMPRFVASVGAGGGCQPQSSEGGMRLAAMGGGAQMRERWEEGG